MSRCTHENLCPFREGVAGCRRKATCPFPAMRPPSNDGLHHYEMSPRPLFGRQEQVADVAQFAPRPSLSPVDLKPGQKHTLHVYRPLTVQNLWPYLLYGAVGGAFASASASSFGADAKLSFGIGGGVFAVGFIATGIKMLFVEGPNPLTMMEEIVQVDLDGDGQVGPAREEIDVVVNDRAPHDRRLRQQVRLTLFSPESNPGGLYRYAAALTRDDGSQANFSYAGGKNVNGAKFYGYTLKEWREFEKIALGAKLVKPRKHSNQPYEWTRRGTATFERVAKHKLETMHLSPAPEASA